MVRPLKSIGATGRPGLKLVPSIATGAAAMSIASNLAIIARLRHERRAVTQLRVVLDTMPAMLADIVRGVALAVPGTIVAEAVATDRLVATVSRLRPDIVIVGGSTVLLEDPASLDALLCGGGRRVRVIALSIDGRNARLHDLRPHVTVLDDLSSAALLGAMQSDTSVQPDRASNG